MYILALILIILASCGSSLAEPRSTYVPPSAYLKFDCPQLLQEARAVFTRSSKAAGLQQSDPVMIGNQNKSTTVRWPKALSLIGDSSIKDELALMRGQLIAIEDASIGRQCSIQFYRAPG
jgi:hypothetical protein